MHCRQALRAATEFAIVTEHAFQFASLSWGLPSGTEDACRVGGAEARAGRLNSVMGHWVGRITDKLI